MKARQHHQASNPTPEGGANRLRIIGGRWRGTRLHFPEIAAIRPTPDRVRETLFNWLQQEVVGTRCLDLFAGSGALGLEALSRGAQSVEFVDQEPQIAPYLRDTLQRLKCSDARAHSMDALHYLQQATATFDLVFLDPPFAATASGDLLSPLLQLLDSPNRLSNHAWIYLECPAQLGAPNSLPDWPPLWRLHRSKQAGQVGYHLARRSSPDASNR
jgi:16S rRNA (guanine966-N2)-methyltransferase